MQAQFFQLTSEHSVISAFISHRLLLTVENWGEQKVESMGRVQGERMK